MGDEVGRGAVREIVPGLVYQRGQILTWPREQKAQLLRARGIAWVVNLWPKIDPDMTELVPRGYIYLPLPQSKTVVENYITGTAAWLAGLVTPQESALILCEAGKTRSAFFAALMATYLLKKTGPEALALMQEKVPGLALKDVMVRYLEDLR